MKTSNLLLLTGVCVLGLSSCAGGGAGPGGQVPIMSPAAQAAQEAMTVKAAADANAQAAIGAPIKAGEFSLTIYPDAEAASANAIPVHVLSMKADQVGQYKVMGADNYWKSPGGGAEQRVFGASGSKGPTTMKVPSRDGQDTILIIAKLPNTGGGGDARMMEIPLKRQPGIDPKMPVANPISVRLGRQGLLPN
ncbi:MAG: hypothetical protein JWO82_3039 [Akkermansiaceae bacterium]|nr:hypothetical protein [Akkermansiaceae bacterium]